MHLADIKSFLAIVAILIGMYGYYPYIRDIFLNKTKPHAFSWLVWCMVTGISCAAQMYGGAGAGGWLTGYTSFMCFVIFCLALSKGEKNILLIDWLCLIFCLLAIPLWIITSTPFWSLLLVIIIDITGFIPTFRKSLSKPYEETLILYSISSFKFFISFLALKEYSLITSLMPLYEVLINAVFVIFVLNLRFA